MHLKARFRDVHISLELEYPLTHCKARHDLSSSLQLLWYLGSALDFFRLSYWLYTLSAQSEISSESSPNVEYGKMRSEWVECALGLDLRGTRSAFYFY